MVHEPSGFLRHADMLRKLDGRNALAAIGQQINRNEPFANWKFAFAKHRARFDGEILFAAAAAIPLTASKRVNGLVTAMRAIFAIAESNGREMLAACFLVFEVFQKLRQRFKLKCVFHSGSRLPSLFRVVKCRNEYSFEVDI
jgi:hypothetical protein